MSHMYWLHSWVRDGVQKTHIVKNRETWIVQLESAYLDIQQSRHTHEQCMFHMYVYTHRYLALSSRGQVEILISHVTRRNESRLTHEWVTSHMCKHVTPTISHVTCTTETYRICDVYRVHIHTYTYIYIQIQSCVYIYIYICIYMHTCVSHIYMYIRTTARSQPSWAC